MRVGRPSDYNEEITAIICARMADGESVRSICSDDDMPSKVTVFRWLGKHEEFRNQYAKACEARSELIADEILDIADDGTNDYVEKRNENGEVVGYTTNGEAIQRSRLRVDTRKWLLGKLQPKKYGDRTILEGGETPIKTEEVANPVETARKILMLIRKAEAEGDV